MILDTVASRSRTCAASNGSTAAVLGGRCHGRRDWGNIDTFAADADTYELTGDWGHVRVESDPPEAQDPS